MTNDQALITMAVVRRFIWIGLDHFLILLLAQ